MLDSRSVLFICEAYYLRFYRPVADHLVRSGLRPIWVMLDGPAPWEYEAIDPGSAVEALVAAPDFRPRDEMDAVCVFERAVFERPDLFRHPYRYTTNVVRTFERARRLAEAWYQVTLALLRRFTPDAVFVWNGRYLPYSAVTSASEAVGNLLMTSEIGWIPGTIFLDRGALSTNTTDLLGRGLESTVDVDTARADAFLTDYTARKATMVSQRLLSPAELRHRFLGQAGTLLVLYGCQVDWDTNVVIGARRFRSNESAISFLLECLSDIPGGRIVVKTHPLDSAKNEGGLSRLVQDRGVVVSDIHPHALIEACDCVVVRNSTLGFEALCYEKPLVVLEQAKYEHPRLTLSADTVAEGAANFQRISAGHCNVPDPLVLRQFIVHLLDRYLLPVRYSYYFEPEKLELLSHFAGNQAYGALERTLGEARPPTLGEPDREVSALLDRCELSRLRHRTFLRRQLRRLSDWMAFRPLGTPGNRH